MPQGLEFHGEWGNKKRKNGVLDSFSSSSSDEWDSGSCSATASKHRKSQLGCQDEVGNDEIHFVGREIFDSATCVAMENVRMSEDGLQGQKDLTVEIQGTKSVNHLETPGRQGKQRIGDRDDGKNSQESLALNENRKCMLTIISELKETKEKMLIWLHQEVQKIINDGCGGSGVRIGNVGQMEFEEHCNADSSGIAVLGNGNGEIDFGGERSASGGTGYAKQNSLIDGAEYSVRNGDTDLGFEKQNDNTDGMGSGFGSQKSVGQADVDMGGRSNSEGMGFDNQTRCPSGEVAVPLQNGSVSAIPLGNQRDAVVGLRNPNVLCREMTFGAEKTLSSCGIGLNYASHAGRGSGMFFGKPTGMLDGARGRGGVGIRSSEGMGNAQSLVNSLCERPINGLQISGEERTSDLFRMHNQGLQLHNPAPSSMMWNDVMENPRDVSHSIHFDPHNKLSRRGIGPYRGLVCSPGYDNSSGIMNSPGLQVTDSSLGIHLPISMQNMVHGSLNSSCMPPFLGMHNQAMSPNFSGTQNFLGLSVNGSIGPAPPLLEEGMNTHVFPGLYHNDDTQHVSVAKPNHLPASPGIRGRTYKKGGADCKTDKLELNT